MGYALIVILTKILMVLGHAIGGIGIGIGGMMEEEMIEEEMIATAIAIIIDIHNLILRTTSIMLRILGQ